MPIILLSPDGEQGLSPRPALPPEILERGNPSITGHTYYSQAGTSCVVWGATPYRIFPKQRPDFEFSILLDGEVVLTDGDGRDTIVKAGDAFVLPAAFTYQWGQTVPVLKFAMSYRPVETTPEGSIFTPMTAETLQDSKPVGRKVLFSEPQGRFQVILQDIAPASPVALPKGMNLVKTVKGHVLLSDGDGSTLKLSAGQVALISNPISGSAEAISDARLLICSTLS